MSRRSPVRSEMRRGKRRLIIDFFYNDKSGRRRRFRRDASVQTRVAARAEAERLIELAARTGSPTAQGDMPTFGAFVTDVFRPVVMPRYRAGTRKRYEDLFRQSVLGAFGRKRLDEVDWIPVQRFAAELRERGVDPRGAGNLVRSVMRAAVEAGVLESFPRLPTFKQSEKLPEAPAVDEVQSTLDVTNGWLRTAVALGVLGGLRSGEIRALRVGDIRFSNGGVTAGEIHVRRAFSGDELEKPKGNRERIVPMTPELAAILREAVRDKLPTAFVVTTRTGRVPRRQYVLSALNRAQDRAGLPRRSVHMLRHFFCSRVLQLGGNVEAVRALMGHSKLTTTARYAHVVTADMQDAIARLGGN